MTSRENITLGQISYLYSLIGNIPPTPPPYPTSSGLDDVLTNNPNTDQSAFFKSNLLLPVETTTISSTGISVTDNFITPSYTTTIANTGISNNNDMYLTSGSVLDIYSTNDLNITSFSESVAITSNNNTALTAGVNGSFIAGDNLTLTASAVDVTLSAGNDVGITSINGATKINSPNGNTSLTAGVNGSFLAGNNLTLTAQTQNLNLNAPSGSGIFNAPTGISLTTNNVYVSNGTNDTIVIAPNISTHVPKITLTDGTTANEMTNSGFTTTLSNANATNYLAFVSDAVDGTILPIRKTAGISCNPSTNVITCGINLPTNISGVSTGGGVVTLNVNGNTFREYSYSMASGSSITGININNSRMNGRYRIYLTAQGAGGTLNKILTTTAGFLIYTSYVGNQTILAFTTYILDIQVITTQGNPPAFCVSLTKFD